MQKRWYQKGDKKRELTLSPKQALDYGWVPAEQPEAPQTPNKPQKPETKPAAEKAETKTKRATKAKSNHPDIKE